MTLIEKHSRLAAERVAHLLESRKTKKPTADEIAALINAEFLESAV